MAAYGDISLVKIQLQISAIKCLISRIYILEMNKSSNGLPYTGQRLNKVVW